MTTNMMEPCYCKHIPPVACPGSWLYTPSQRINQKTHTNWHHWL